MNQTHHLVVDGPPRTDDEETDHEIDTEFDENPRGVNSEDEQVDWDSSCESEQC